MTVLNPVRHDCALVPASKQAPPRTSARQRTSKQKARHRLILDAAREEFLKHGFAATSMSDIAARVGGSKTTLWSYFPSKKMLFVATVEDAASSLHSQMDEIFQSDCDAQQTLYAFASKLVDRVTSHGSLQIHRLIVGEGARFPELGRIFYEAAFKPLHGKLEAYLAAEMKSGRLLERDANQAAYELFGLILQPQQFLSWSVEGTLVEAARTEGYVRAAINSFLRAYRPPDQATGV